MHTNIPTVIAVSNGKGGVGKTTYCMHLISTFLSHKIKVLSIDLDTKQRSLTTYLENRQKYAEDHPKENVLMPQHFVLPESQAKDIDTIALEELASFSEALNSAYGKYDIVIVDTPGDFSHRSVLAHSSADIVLTPINDSFVDLSVLAKLDANLKSKGPAIYSNVIWEQKIGRAKVRRSAFDWFVIRNRINTTATINKQKISQALKDLSKQLGFKTIKGFGDRVIFKDLFLYGLTLSDIGKTSYVKSFTPANLAAKTELRELISSLGLLK